MVCEVGCYLVHSMLSLSNIHVHIYWLWGPRDQSFGHQKSITNGNIRVALCEGDQGRMLGNQAGNKLGFYILHECPSDMLQNKLTLPPPELYILSLNK